MIARWIAAISLLFLTSGYLGSQEVPSFSAFLGMPWSGANWETSHYIPRHDPGFIQAISVPFVFPMETVLLRSYQSVEPGWNRTTAGRDVRFPSLWEKNHSWTGQRGITFLYRRKNFGLNLDLSLQMAGNGVGANWVEATLSKVRFSYQVPNSMLGIRNDQVRLDLFLELAELHVQTEAGLGVWNRPVQNALHKSPENANRPSFNTKQIYANPGVALRTSSLFTFEGTLRVPMNAREANRTLDELWTPEIQTNLGMKYVFPAN